MEGELYFRKTRKVYTWFYLTSIFLLIYYINLRIHGVEVNNQFVIAGILFIVLGINFIEIGRLHHIYGFNSEYVFHKHGFVKKKLKKVFLGRISDIVLSRGILNRILNYGNVEVHHFGGSGVIEVKKINRPQKFIEDLQDIMNKL